MAFLLFRRNLFLYGNAQKRFFLNDKKAIVEITNVSDIPLTKELHPLVKECICSQVYDPNIRPPSVKKPSHNSKGFLGFKKNM
jgi:hypothetical protein